MTDKATTSAGSGLPEIKPSIGGRRPRKRKGETVADFVTRGMGNRRMLEAFPRSDMRYQALREAFAAPLKEARPRACVVVLRVPDAIGDAFPERPEDDSPPHVTLNYVGEADAATVALVVEAVNDVAAALDPWPMSLEDYGEFTNDDGKVIAHLIPRAEGGPEVAQVSWLVERALADRGVVPKAHPGPFRPHATLAYLDAPGYDGPRPSGRWLVEAIEVWAGPDAEPVEVRLSGPEGAAAKLGMAGAYHPPEGGDALTEAMTELWDGWLGGPVWARTSTLQEGGVVQLFGSPAGKSQVARKLLPMFPPHRVYTEACAGGAAMFFAKESAPGGSVLGDANADLCWLYDTARDLSDADIKTLREGFDWKSTRKQHQALREERKGLRATAATEQDRLRRFWRELYLRRFGYKSSPDAFHPGSEGHVARTADKLERLRAKLAGTVVRNQDAAATIREFDAPDAFHFLDPPWPGFNQGVRERGYDPMPLMEACAGALGRYLIIYQGAGFDRLTEMDPRAHLSTPKWTTMNTRREGGSFGPLEYRIITNYDPAEIGRPPSEMQEAVREALWALRRLA